MVRVFIHVIVHVRVNQLYALKLILGYEFPNVTTADYK